MPTQLIVDDNFVKEIASEIYLDMRKMDAVLNSYNKILSLIRSAAIKDGDTAEALDAFAEYASRLNGELINISSSIQSLANSYIANIDKADSYLF